MDTFCVVPLRSITGRVTDPPQHIYRNLPENVSFRASAHTGLGIPRIIRTLYKKSPDFSVEAVMLALPIFPGRPTYCPAVMTVRWTVIGRII